MSCVTVSPPRPPARSGGHREPLSVKVLIVGATGFIGARLVPAFEARGDETWRAGRARIGGNSSRSISIDFTAPDAATWARELQGFDVVVNAVGALRDRGRQTLQALHVSGPRALFSAAVSARV